MNPRPPDPPGPSSRPAAEDRASAPWWSPTGRPAALTARSSAAARAAARTADGTTADTAASTTADTAASTTAGTTAGTAASTTADTTAGTAASTADGTTDGTTAGTTAGTAARAAHPFAPRRFPLALLPTPLHRARRLEGALDLPAPLLLKRDDLIGFGLAGNKTRPLEHLLGAALDAGADILVTGGGPGSNFCPAAALAARAAGLACELVVWGAPAPGAPLAPNLALAVAAGATLYPTGDTDRSAVDERVARRAAELRAAGRHPFPVPRGGSTPLGAVGFADAAAELAGQLAAPPDPPPAPSPGGAPCPRAPDRADPGCCVVVAVGSGGSCAGLLAGFAAVGFTGRVVAVSVSRPLPEITARVRELAAGCAALLGGPAPLTAEFVDARGPGFGTATASERALARLALHTEGLLLDETYGAEAFAVAVDRARAGEPVVYWHTGGLLPAVTALTREDRA